MTQTETEFKQALAFLNPNQLQAVNAIDGPVLTLAGPGTGKTQVLTLRIGQILKKTQMNPSNILCLTFTEAAATEMKQRLISFIGVNAYDVKITTFHAFANSIIQEFSHKFGETIADEESDQILEDLTQIDSLDRLKIINQIIDQKNWQYIKPFKSPLYYLKNLSSMVSTMKLERIDPDILKQNCKKELAEIIASDESVQKKQATLINKLNRTIELSDFFKIYQLKLQANYFYDYEDMINWVVDKLQTDPELALIYQEKYQYILVDEYQDTNNSQLALIRCLTSHFKDNPNLFVVGDPNQSIYRFQGASHKNIDDFIQAYPNALRINLIENYRSPQLILNAAHDLIQNSSDLVENPNLHANNKIEGVLKLNNYLQVDQEIGDIAQKVSNLIKSGIKPNSIAILVRQNNLIDDFVRSLEEYNIPAQITSGESVLNNPYTQKILAIFELLLEPFDRDIFARAIFFFRKDIGLGMTYNINRLGPKQVFSDNLEKTDPQYPLDSKTKQLISQIKLLAENIDLLPTAQILEKIIKDFKLIQEIGHTDEKITHLESLKTLLNAAKNQNQLKPSQWLDQLKLKKSYDLDLLTEPILYGENNAVIIQTIHQSKGREYDYVFLPRLEDRMWSTGKSSNFYLPEFSPNQANASENEICEQRRLLYVGITRTIKECYLSVSQNNNLSTILPSRFISELGSNVKKEEILESPKAAQVRVERAMLPVNKKNENRDREWLKQIISQKPLTPTGYTAYHNCPKNYLLTNILLLPSVKSVAAAYGTAIHYALEKYFNEFKLSHTKPDLNQLKKFFDKRIEQEILSPVEKEAQLEKGHELLSKWYEKDFETFIPAVETEYKFATTQLGEIPIKGKIDKIEFQDESKGIVRVVDYKTGKVRSRNDLLGLTKANRTDYVDQLRFYNVLGKINRQFKIKWTIGESQLYFMDDNFKFTKENFQFSQIEINDFELKIKETWDKMQNLEFEHNPNNQRDCEYCDTFNILD